jgi:hypothetical protein
MEGVKHLSEEVKLPSEEVKLLHLGTLSYGRFLLNFRSLYWMGCNLS